MGAVGYLMRIAGFPFLPLILGVVLGHMVESPTGVRFSCRTATSASSWKIRSRSDCSWSRSASSPSRLGRDLRTAGAHGALQCLGGDLTLMTATAQAASADTAPSLSQTIAEVGLRLAVRDLPEPVIEKADLLLVDVVGYALRRAPKRLCGGGSAFGRARALDRVRHAAR